MPAAPSAARPELELELDESTSIRPAAAATQYHPADIPAPAAAPPAAPFPAAMPPAAAPPPYQPAGILAPAPGLPAPVSPLPSYAPAPKTSRFALTAAILGGVSLVLGAIPIVDYLTVLAAIVGLVLGILALLRAPGSRVLAIVGVVLSAVGLVLSASVAIWATISVIQIAQLSYY